MNDIRTSVMDQIKKGAVKPRPKWQFVLAHVLLWSAFVGSVILGSIATSLVLRHFIAVEWGFLGHIGRNSIHGFMLIVPYLWFAVLALVTFLAYFVFVHTKGGYRYKPWIVVVASIALSIVVGSVLYGVRAADYMEDRFREHIGPYDEWQQKRDKHWVAPERGILGGRIDELDGLSHFTLEDVAGNDWEVEVPDEELWAGEDPREGIPVIIKGRQIDEDTFEAEYIRFGKRDFAHPKKRGKRLKPPRDGKRPPPRR